MQNVQQFAVQGISFLSWTANGPGSATGYKPNVWLNGGRKSSPIRYRSAMGHIGYRGGVLP